MKERIVNRNKGCFKEPPQAVPNGNVDVSGGGRWKIWQDAGTRIDAPVLGNGSMLSAFVGLPQWPQFWITTNDFWQMESAANWEFFHDNSEAKHDPPVSLGGPRPVGRMVFDIPQLKEASCTVEQEYATGTTHATYSLPYGKNVEISSWVAATENVLVVEFLPEFDLQVSFDFYFPDETGKGCDTGVDIWGSGESSEKLNGMFIGLTGGRPVQMRKIQDGMVSGYREFSERVDMPVKAGFAGCFLADVPGVRSPKGRETTQVLKQGERSCFVLPLRTWAKVSRPYEYACSRAKWMSVSELNELRREHLSWWNAFWDISEVELDDPLIEQRYYLSQYMLACVSGDPDYPPNILGISTFDRPAWNGNYKINYNHQSPYLNLLVSGHFKQADPHDKPYLDLLDISREMSKRLLSHEGAYYPLGLGPHGMVSEALLLYMKSPAVHGALNMLIRYRLTEDLDYARKVYPFLISVADFWEKDLVKRDGRYHIVGDGMHERVTRNIREEGYPEDPVNTLGYLKVFFDFMPKISRDLGINEDRIETWKEIRDHLADYPVGTIREIQDNPTLWTEADAELCDLLPDELLDIPIYYDEGKGGKWSFHFPGNVMQIYPGCAIGLGSSEEELQIARNTVHIHAVVEDALAEKLYQDDVKAGKTLQDRHFYKAGAWNASNLSCLFFTAAARAGYDPDRIWEEMAQMIRHRGLPNGFLKENPHGIEQLNTIPDTIQEMMLQSQEDILRIFPVWPRKKHPNAAFRNFRAYGAFKVSARLAGGEVSELEIVSCKGNSCTLENPWKGSRIMIRHIGSGLTEVLEGDVVTFATCCGEQFRVSKMEEE
jgi:hypothetical protein